MKIISMTSGYDPQTGLKLFGLGDDNKVYIWDARLGGWHPNWFLQSPAQPAAPAPANRAARRSAGSKRK